MSSDPSLVAGRFRLEDELGRGGAGVVYRALDAVTGQRVALKLIDSGDGLDVERLLVEGRLLARVAHPNVVRAVASGVQDRSPTRSPPPTPPASCTATCRRATSWSPSAATRCT